MDVSASLAFKMPNGLIKKMLKMKLDILNQC